MATSQPAQGKSAAFSQADQWRATASSVTVENNFFYLLAELHCGTSQRERSFCFPFSSAHIIDALD